MITRFHNRKMLMQKLAIILVVAGLLSAGCSRQKEETADTTKTSPSPNLQKRMEEQQKAIQRASAQVQKEQDQKAAAEKSASPSQTPR
jgi:ABC-type glycerol-3-phosphate transport system substrate-binding protein